MALSPIQLYQQQQNPLAQILQGGNQTIASIFDRAVQIGRDMSNKQLQQEQDMIAMRKTETAMAQRRAENLQQNNEDAIKFARNAFESDRKFSVDQTHQQFQNERVTANDLFGQQTDTARLDIAREGLDLQTDKFEADKAQAEQARTDVLAARQQSKDSYTNLITGGQPKTITEAVDVHGMVSGKSSQSSGLKTPQSFAEAKSLYSAAEKAGDGAAMSHFGKYVDNLAKGPSGSSTRPVDLTVQAGRDLTNEQKAFNLFKDKGKFIVEGNSEAFVSPLNWMSQKYGTESNPDGGRMIKRQKGDEEGATPEQIREVEAYEKDPVAAEASYAASYATAEEYADALDKNSKTKARPSVRQARINLWNEYMKAMRGVTSGITSTSSGAPPTAPSSAESLLDSYMK